MIKHVSFLTLQLLLVTLCLSQPDGYWQQEVHYHIDVTLDDERHQLQGQMDLTYLNHSPDELDTIYLHLWGNAFRDPTTPFAEQQLRQGKQEFYFADTQDLGFYSKLDFRIDGRPTHWSLVKEAPDVAYLLLPSPLSSGDSLRISTSFVLNIPASFSRLGHVGQSYQMTQWYPKPAVYDRYGWHPMSYLDTGEFYSEFGSYEVSITLPANYIVGATGTLQTESERKWLLQKAGETGGDPQKKTPSSLPRRQAGDFPLPPSDFPLPISDFPFPPSSAELKTLHYTAENVHDFAWFADKRFQVQHGLTVLPSGREVDIWAFYTEFEAPLWQDALKYIDRALRFYSERVGEYPYPQMTAVQSALSAGSGMEYPMVTVIGGVGTTAALDEVITHEVGHNWFYGVLASNERRHPWMDEGINTYYEQRYMRSHYEKTELEGYLPGFLRQGSDMSLTELSYLYRARRHRDQAPDTPSEAFTELNYFLGAYVKTAVAFRYLEAYLGTGEFDRLMQGFYRKWAFRHPYPDDLQQYLEKGAGKNLDWLFDSLIGNNAWMDYAFTRLEKVSNGYQVQVKNRGAVAAPFSLSGIENGKVDRTRWYEGIEDEQTLYFPEGDYERIELDAYRLAPELYRQNNHIRTGGLFPKLEPLKISLLPSLENDRRTQLFFYPLPGWNEYDKFMLGGILHNGILPAKRLEFQFAPMFGFGSRDLTGLGQLQYHFFPKAALIQEITLGIGGKTFNFFASESLDYRLRYGRLMPFLQIELGAPAAIPFSHRLQWRSLWINQEAAQFEDGTLTGKEWTGSLIHELSYRGDNQRAVNPFSFALAFEQQSYEDIGGSQHYLKASLEWTQHFTYREGKNIDLRIFAGSFLLNTRRNGGRLFPGAFNLTAQGFNDYRYDELYFGRTETEGIGSQQISLREGAFKTPLGSAFALGRSNNFVLAMNLKLDLPQRFLLPIKPYLDLGYFDNAQPTGRQDSFEDQFLWSAGLALEIGDGLIGIYFPLLHAQHLENRLQERGNYWTRVSFNIDLARFNPFSAIKKLPL